MLLIIQAGCQAPIDSLAKYIEHTDTKQGKITNSHPHQNSMINENLQK